MDAAAKKCVTCQLVQPLTEFNLRRAAPDGRQARCRTCSKAWYVVNREAHKENVRVRNKRVRAIYRQRVAEYLLAHPCVDCGEDDVRVLDFDHEDPAQKSSEVVRLASFGIAWERVLAEIAKCSVRCANCHRKRTAEMFGYWRAGAERVRRDARGEAAARRLTAILQG
jgi:hypothetical protein